MNMKRILVLVLTLTMLLSTFAPTLGVFAETSQNVEQETDDGVLDYVSLGDSMSNGIGFNEEGYDSKNQNGYLEIATPAYPAQFAEWLKSFTGKDVNLTQLATSGARIEDLYYALTYDTEKEIPVNIWTQTELLDRWNRWGTLGIDSVSATHKEAVTNADIISLATGNGNFGVFLMGRIMNLVGFGSAEDLADDQANYGYMTIENAVALCGANEEVKELVLDAYANAYDYLAEMGLPMDLIDTLAQYTAYTTASYVVYTMKTIDLIVEMNPDVTLMIVPLINNGLNFNFQLTLNGITKSFDAGDFLGALYTPLNAFLAAYPTAKQAAGEFKDATFLYAELPVDENGETIQVETFAQAFDELYAPVVDVNEDGTITVNEYPANRLFCHNRFYGEIQTFVMPIILGGNDETYEDKFNEYDVRAYEIAKANGTAAFAAYAAANAEKTQLIAYYLGIVDAVLSSMKSTANVNLDEISLPEGDEFSIFSILGPVIGDLGTTVYNKVEANATAVAPRLAYDLIAANITPVLEPYFSNDEFLYVFGSDLDIYGDDSVEKTLEMINLAMNNDSRFELNDDLKAMKAALVDGYNTIASGLSSLAMVTVLPETLSEELTSVGLLEALLALYGRLKLAWGLSAHPSAAGHDTLTDSLANAYENEYTTKDETIENIKLVGEFIAEYYDEAYAYGYNYIDENGYVDAAVAGIDKAIEGIYVAIEEVEAGLLGTTDELTAELIKELYATIETLKELREVLATDSAEDVEGLVAAVFELEDDLYTHLNNIYAILRQAGIDVNQLVLLPAFREALYILETEVIPAVKEAVEAFVNAVVEYVQAKVEYYYGVAYDYVVEMLVKIQLYAQEKLHNAIAPLLDAYNKLVDLYVEIYGTVEEAVRIANLVFGKLLELNEKLDGALTDAMDKVVDLFITLYNAYGNVEDALLALNGILMNIVTTVDETIDAVIEAYNALVAKLLAIYDTVEEALNKANEIFNAIVEKVENEIAKAVNLFNAIVDALANTYGNVKNIVTVAFQIFERVYNFFAEDVDVAKMFNDIVEIVKTAYGATQDAYYVATQVYAYLVETVYHAFNGNYELTDDSAYVSLGNATYGEALAKLLNLTGKYNNFGLTENYLDAVAGADLVTIKVNNGEFFEFVQQQAENLMKPAELDWSKYLDAEGQAALEEVLEAVKADVLANSDLLEQFNGVGFAPEFAANTVAYAVESLLYAYAEFTDRLITVLNNVYDAAPNATVVLTAIENPLYGLELGVEGLGIDFTQYANTVQYVVDALNAHLVAAAVARENTIYVNSNEAADIYDALHVHCEHVYTDCEDTTCDRCGAERTAPGHVYGEWVVVLEPTTEAEGRKEQTCEVCGHVKAEAIEKLPSADDPNPPVVDPDPVDPDPVDPVTPDEDDGLSTAAIVAIVVGCVVVVAGAGAAVYYFAIKKKAVKAPAKTEEKK